MICKLNEADKAVKKYIFEYFNDAVKHYAALPPISERAILEGDGVITVHEDGSEKRTEFRKIEASETQIVNEIGGTNPEEIFKLLDKMAFKMACGQVQLMQDAVSEAVAEVGNVVNHKGKITPENIFEMYRKVTLDFYRNGEPRLLAIVAAPEMTKEHDDAMNEIKGDENLKKQFEEIIAMQRKNWNVRESNRKLVG